MAHELTKRIGQQEQAELIRAVGHLESRKRFKYKSGSPLHEERVADLLFVDESGVSEPNSPVDTFALAAVAVSPANEAMYIEEANNLKLDFFGRTDVTFHEPQMRNHDGRFRFENDISRQEAFCLALDDLVGRIDFTAFGVVIRKTDFRAFVESAVDPYLPPDAYATAIHMLFERYVDYLAMTRVHDPRGKATFESQGPREDAEHHVQYVDLLLHGTQWVPDSAFRNWLETGVHFTKKQGSSPIELSDMLARDLFEWVRAGCGNDMPRRLHVFNRKIYRRDDMRMGKFGVKIFPDSDIKDLVDAHRARCAAN